MIEPYHASQGQSIAYVCNASIAWRSLIIDDGKLCRENVVGDFRGEREEDRRNICRRTLDFATLLSRTAPTSASFSSAHTSDDTNI